MHDNNALITKADKGHTLVIIHNDTYTQKVHKFISDNNIEIIKFDPTDSYVRSLNNTINNCTNLFNDRTRRSLKPINARAPKLTGLPKIHKDDIPIRPLVNFTTAPGFKTAKNLVTLITDNIFLKNNHIIVNNIDFINKVNDIKLQASYKLASFDIINLYTNIPVNQTLDILNDNLHVCIMYITGWFILQITIRNDYTIHSAIVTLQLEVAKRTTIMQVDVFY